MLNNLRIGSRLSLGFGLLLALLCAMAGVSAWQMGRLAGNTDYYMDDLVPSFEAQHDIALQLDEVRRDEYQHVLANAPAEMDQIEGRIADARKAIADGLAHYDKELVSDDEDRRDMRAVDNALAAYSAAWEQVRPVSRESATDPSKNDEATKLLQGDSRKAFEAAHAAIATWWAYNVKLARQGQVDAGRTYADARIALAGLVAVALVLGFGASWLITRSITRPIGQAVRLAETVAAGDLSARIEAEGRDEAAQLLRALGHMNASLARIVHQVRDSSESIATGSAQIATGNADLSQRTEEQASNLQQTTASMGQLSDTVRTSAANAATADQLSAQAAAAAAHGGEMVGQVVRTMQEIADSSRRIADIIGVIDSIAFQTNILALNAAVEAARAGEQGRGFAVVASEVRSLAQRSAAAAKEIKTLIGDSVGKVDAGTRQVDDAGASMSEIVAQVQRASQLIAEISSTASEQSTGIAQVGDAVAQLDQVTQQNAALVEESAAAAESLRHQAGQLAELVRQFKVGAVD